jgi:hypothetical protein
MQKVKIFKTMVNWIEIFKMIKNQKLIQKIIAQKYKSRFPENF